jgi:hypothetical protein
MSPVRVNPSLAMALDAFAEFHGASYTASPITVSGASGDGPRDSKAGQAALKSKEASGR